MRSQRHDPYPWTWEPAAATLCILTILGLIAARAGTTLAAWILGQPTPHGNDLVDALNALAQAPIPEQAITIGSIITAELVALITAGWGIHRLAHNAGAIGPRGFATTTEAQRTLGPTRLHRHRRIIRPDLHKRSWAGASANPLRDGGEDPSRWSSDYHSSHQTAPDTRTTTHSRSRRSASTSPS